MTTKQQVKELWKLCFKDSEEFTELYFSLRYNDDVNIAIQSGNKIISALQMLPYPMTFCGTEVDTSYISGACTHPDYRGKGVMKELLLQAFVQMSRKNIPLSTLIPAEPWLFDYYAQMGYAPVFHYTEQTIKPEHIDLPEGVEIIQTTEFCEKAYAYFTKKMHERPCCIQHTQADYRVILEDMRLSNSKVLIACKDNEVAGIAFVTSQKILELLAENESIENFLIQKAVSLYHTEEIIRITPPDTNKNIPKPLGMARIICAGTMLRHYAAANPTKELIIGLTDFQLPANNGYYHLTSGKCVVKKEQPSAGYIKLSINELSEMIFSPAHPYMSLMLN